MSDKPEREWTYADEPCTYTGGLGCNLPLRTHTHYSHGPGDPFHVEFWDEREKWGPADRAEQSA